MPITGTAALFLLAGRLLFGVLLGYQGLNHFVNLDQLSGYAQAKGVPAARLLVVASGAMLVLGGLAVATGAYAAVGAGALAVFLLVTTPVMHDFWTMSGEDRQNEQVQFLKNAELLGASLAFLAVSGMEWGYALGVGLF